MNQNSYLIPANSKKSLLFFGLFNKFDMIFFGTGISITVLCIMILPIADIKFALISIAPVTITGLLVFPVPYYHNTMTAIHSMWVFFTTRQRFIWKGWCVREKSEDGKK